MDHIDYKYVLLTSSRLDLFKDIGNGVYNFRCPFCGDSKIHRNKARGYLFPVDDTVMYKCHNCGKSTNLSNFLAEIDHGLYTQYKLEKFGKPKISKENTLNFTSSRHIEFASKTKDILRDCYPLRDIPEDLEPVIKYAR
ncbi:MAG: DNA primase, partial [Candidatus Bathyarchaeia archaeon]